MLVVPANCCVGQHDSNILFLTFLVLFKRNFLLIPRYECMGRGGSENDMYGRNGKENHVKYSKDRNRRQK